VKENSVNLIFAVTEEQLHVYNLLSGAVEGSSYGKRFVPFHFSLALYAISLKVEIPNTQEGF
jgi:hypothetical protein